MKPTINNLYDEKVNKTVEYYATTSSSYFLIFSCPIKQSFKVSYILKTTISSTLPSEKKQIFRFEFTPVDLKSKKNPEPQVMDINADQLREAFKNIVELNNGSFEVTTSVIEFLALEQHWTSGPYFDTRENILTKGRRFISLKFDQTCQLREVNIKEELFEFDSDGKLVITKPAYIIFNAKNLQCKAGPGLAQENTNNATSKLPDQFIF